MRWWHIQLGTYCTWLPGDKRGFRSRDHRIHSSGDYKAPPPPGGHAGLRSFHAARHPTAVRIPRPFRLTAATAIARALTADGYRVLAVAVCAKHAHALAELPVDRSAYRRALGRAKLAASKSLTDVLPGRVWARGDRHDLIRDRKYQRNAYIYIREKQGPEAGVWCHDGLRQQARRE